MIKAVRLADIAEKVGVSVVTVSKALSGQKGVSEQMRERIKHLADEMGYEPVHAAQPHPNRSFTVGVITFENYFARLASFYWKMYQVLANHAAKSGCFAVLEVISDYDENNYNTPKLISENKADGIIVIGKPKKDYLKQLYQHSKMPMLFLDFYDDELVVDAVVSSGFYGTYFMTDYLIKKGHEKIAFVGTLMYTESITDRYFGYAKALMEAGIEQKKEWILKDRDYPDGKIGLEYRIELPDDMPTAFVCNNDVTAYALIRQLEMTGLRVPHDVSVVGYDDYLYPEMGDSRITTFSVDVEEMARIAVDSLLKKMNGIGAEPGIHMVFGRLIERESAAGRER